MALECFEPKKFTSDRLQLINLCNEIIQDYSDDGYQLTTRQLYYQLVAQDLIPNTTASYDKTKGLVRDARMVGAMDWDAIVDRTRSVVQVPTWSVPSSILNAATESFRVDHWNFQPCHVLVMCEKQALEGVLEPAANRWGLPYTSNKGYPSVSLLYSIAQDIKDQVFVDGRNVDVIYFGDHDPSGLNMDEDLLQRLELFSQPDKHDTTLNLHRVALTYDQIEEYEPPPNPAKMTDPRSQKYVEQHGESSWELDALKPNTLVDVLDATIEQIIERHGSSEIWEKSHQLETDMQKELQAITRKTRTDKWMRRITRLYEARNDIL